MTQKRKIVSVIGPNQARCNVDLYSFGQQLGKAIAEEGFVIVCGGMYGFMEAVCKGAKSAKNYISGSTIGIIPCEDKHEASDYVDVVIPTGMGWARNQLIINTADVVVAVSGGAGTLSELACAWQKQKPVVCYTGFDGWSKELSAKGIDSIKKNVFKPAASIEDIIKHIKYGI